MRRAVKNRLVCPLVLDINYVHRTSFSTAAGREILWCDTVKYLSVYPTATSVFRCSHDYAIRAFYRAFNGIFVKVGRAALEEVVIQLLKAKCLPVLFYG